MSRAPFPLPGERLADTPDLHDEPRRLEARTRRVSMFGGIGYAPGHPSRWAGFRQGGTTRLTVEGDIVVLRPLAFWRKTLRLPTVRIPIDTIERASKMLFGVKFSVPGDPALDGTRFYSFAPDPTAIGPLIKLLASRGIPIEILPPWGLTAMGLRNRAVASRPGWIWRDRGPLAFVETIVALSVGFGILYLIGFFTHPPHFFLVALAAFAAYKIVFSLAGYRIRRRATRRDDPNYH